MAQRIVTGLPLVIDDETGRPVAFRDPARGKDFPLEIGASTLTTDQTAAGAIGVAAVNGSGQLVAPGGATINIGGSDITAGQTTAGATGVVAFKGDGTLLSPSGAPVAIGNVSLTQAQTNAGAIGAVAFAPGPTLVSPTGATIPLGGASVITTAQTSAGATGVVAITAGGGLLTPTGATITPTLGVDFDASTGALTKSAAPLKLAPLVAMSLAPSTQAVAEAEEAARVAVLSKIWAARRAALAARDAPKPNVGTVTYVDLLAATDGDGTSFLTPRNVWPGSSALVDKTVLLAERTTYTTPTVGAGTPSLQFLTCSSSLLGTYSRRDGSRVFDRDRVATINCNGNTRGLANGSANTTNGVTLSGLRITNLQGATNYVRAVLFTKPSAAAAISGLTVEHVYIDDVRMTDTTTAQDGMAIESYANNTTVRYCDIQVRNCDALYIATASNDGGKSPHIYGNRFVILKDGTTNDDVDCIQLFNSGTGFLGLCEIHDNWLENQANEKQVAMLQDSAAGTTTQCLFYRNVCVGASLATSPAGVGVNQKVVNLDIPGAKAYENYVSGGEYGIFASKPGCAIERNFIVQQGADGTATQRGAITSYQSNTTARNNTIVLNQSPGGIANVYGVYMGGGTTGNVCTDNVFAGRGKAMRLTDGNVTEERNTVFVQGLAREATAGGTNSGVSQTLGTGSTSNVDPQLTLLGFPIALTPSAAAISAVADDLYGSPWRGYRGAVQSLVSSSLS